MQENLLEVGLVQNSDGVRYAELKIYMHNSYVKSKNRWPKIMLAVLNLIVNCTGGNRPPCTVVLIQGWH